MTFPDYHAHLAEKFNLSPEQRHEVANNDQRERAGEEKFKQENYSNCLERAIDIYMPYYDASNMGHEVAARVYALAIANHRSGPHEEDRANEMAEYKDFILTNTPEGEEPTGEQLVEEATSNMWWLP
jgi:hypothetical protein